MAENSAAVRESTLTKVLRQSIFWGSVSVQFWCMFYFLTTVSYVLKRTVSFEMVQNLSTQTIYKFNEIEKCHNFIFEKLPLSGPICYGKKLPFCYFQEVMEDRDYSFPYLSKLQIII